MNLILKYLSFIQPSNNNQLDKKNHMNNKEIKLDYAIGTFLSDQLFEYLPIKTFERSILSLLLCNHYLNIIFSLKLVRYIQYPLKIIDTWDNIKRHTNRSLRKIFIETFQFEPLERLINEFPKISYLTICHFNQYIVIEPGFLPKTLTHLTLGNYNNTISIGSIPSDVQFLTFGEYFNQPLSVGVLPINLKKLIFGEKYENYSNYEQRIRGFKGPIGAIGMNALNEYIYGDFNQILTKDVLPHNLLYLKFGHDFNQSLENILPPNLEYLILGDNFNQPLQNNTLPCKLIHLKIGKKILK